jgi:hypothetical protein
MIRIPASYTESAGFENLYPNRHYWNFVVAFRGLSTPTLEQWAKLGHDRFPYII